MIPPLVQTWCQWTHWKKLEGLYCFLTLYCLIFPEPAFLSPQETILGVSVIAWCLLTLAIWFPLRFTQLVKYGFFFLIPCTPNIYYIPEKKFQISKVDSVHVIVLWHGLSCWLLTVAILSMGKHLSLHFILNMMHTEIRQLAQGRVVSEVGLRLGPISVLLQKPSFKYHIVLGGIQSPSPPSHPESPPCILDSLNRTDNFIALLLFFLYCLINPLLFLLC